MRKLAIGVVIALAAGSALAADPDMRVPLNHTTRVPMNRAAKSVIITDPNIVDVVVADQRSILMVGRNYGRTEVIVLDEQSRPVWDGEVAVVRAEQGRVTMHRGASESDYTCAGSDICDKVHKPAAQSQSNGEASSSPRANGRTGGNSSMPPASPQ